MLLKCIRKAHYTDQLVIGKLYVAMGICVYSHKVDVLILEPCNYPSWHSIEYFVQEDNIIPDGFVACTKFSKKDWCDQASIRFGMALDDDISLMIGYPLLIESYVHYFNLIEGNKEDERIFINEYKKVAHKYYKVLLECKPDHNRGLEFSETQIIYPSWKEQK